MAIFDSLLLGFQTALTLENLMFCFIGVFLGTLIGVLPGIGSLAAIAMLLPVTYYLDPTSAIIMLAGVYYGAEYGGSTASILLNLPGSPSNAITCLDGYPLAQKGRAGVALLITTLASFVGGTIGILVMTFLSPLVVSVAMSMRPADYLAIMLFGLLAAALVSNASMLKGVAMVVLGLLLGCVGLDINSGVPRFTLGVTQFYDGVSLVTLAMGLFGVSEIIGSIRAQSSAAKQHVTLRSMMPTKADLKDSALPSLRGAGIGSLFGTMPATGPSIATFVSYALERKLARDPSRFGQGAIEGIASPESSNNAAVQTAFIPTLTLGVPGSPAMAIILGALLIHGINPGPTLITRHPEMFWGLVASFWIGNIMLLVLNIPMIGLWVRILNIPYRILYPLIIMLVCIGAYSISYSAFDVAAVMGFGVLGYQMRRVGFPPAPLLMGFILGPLIEENLRRALLLSRGDFLPIINRPLALSLLAIGTAYLAYVLIRRLRQPKEATL